MNKNVKPKKYDLEDRTLEFEKSVRSLVKKIPKTVGNIEDGRQVVRSSGSIGANDIEANEALSKKDFLMRMKISRKEAKETRYWLRLLDVQANEELEIERNDLIKESTQLMNILSSIINKFTI